MCWNHCNYDLTSRSSALNSTLVTNLQSIILQKTLLLFRCSCVMHPAIKSLNNKLMLKMIHSNALQH